MLKLILGCILLITHFSTKAQSTNLDSLSKIITTAKEDTNKARAYILMSNYYTWRDPKRAIELGLPGLTLSQKLGYKRGMFNAYSGIGEAMGVSGNNAKSLELKFKALAVAEELKDESLIGYAYLTISGSFFYQGDYRQCIEYAKKSAVQPGYENRLKILYGFQGEAFFKLNQLDSALFYIQKSYELDLVSERHWSIPYYYLAAIYAKKDDPQRAVEYYRKGLSFNLPQKDILIGQLGLATVYYQLGKNDSALHYMRRTVHEGIKFSFLAEVADAAALGKEIHKKNKHNDSALYYHEIMVQAKDSLFSQEQMKQVQNHVFNERLRQQELALQKLKEAEERSHTLQYAGIILGLFLFFIIILLLSHSVVANKKLIRFLGAVALLLLFEFVNLYLHPHLAEATHHSPLWMLLIMVCIAAFLVPLHHKLEQLVINRLVEKNRKIKLAAAKQTIKMLEKENEVARDQNTN